LQNIRSLLKPNGVLILTVPSILAAKPLKHYQHFTEEKLRSLLQETGFVLERCDGQEHANHLFFFWYKFGDNRWWTIKPLMHWMNRVFYPRWVSPCPAERANRLIVVARARFPSEVERLVKAAV
jgi:SAM-dependent methyltransferase